MRNKQIVAVAGNIGVGKSVLTRFLSEKFNWTSFYEAVDDNPYLPDFYRDMRKWSFHSQIFFLTKRLQSYREMMSHAGSVIQDRTIYEDAEIFARNLHQCNEISARDYKLYRSLYEQMVEFLSPPDLIIYLKASIPTLIERLHRRGREMEQNITPLYLQRLNELYNHWITNFTLCPVLTISADELDFVRFPEDFNWIVEKVSGYLNGQTNGHGPTSPSHQRILSQAGLCLI